MHDAAAILNLPALLPVGGGAILCESSGAIRTLARLDAAAILRGGDCLIVHAPFVAGRLKTALAKPSFDLLELFAFVHPATPCAPGANGLAEALALPAPRDDAARARTMHEVAAKLIADIGAVCEADQAHMRTLAEALRKCPWRWSETVLAILGETGRKLAPLAGFDVWKTLKKWEDEAPIGKPSAHPVSPVESAARLAALTEGGEVRQEQHAFAEAATHIFAPRPRPGAPQTALIEAGTGTGKTLGYLAPASLWAEKNGPGLWLSTYTRNLQRQIAEETARLYPDPAIRASKAVVRKGRENYLCLLNFEEVVKRSALAGGQRLVALALVSRFVRASADGDMSGAGFPAFLAAHLTLRDISDRRGECIYAACPHYRACFIEKVTRRARKADLVIANHALVIARSMSDEEEGAARPTRFVFDEGHHLFDAADSGFAASLSSFDMAELRRWLRGPEGRASRARGLSERLKDFVAEDAALRDALAEAEATAGVLAGEGFMGRIIAPRGPGEEFLSLVHTQVTARADGWDRLYSQECDVHPCSDDMLGAAAQLRAGLARIQAPLARLTLALRAKANDAAATMEPSTRTRILAHAAGIERRARGVLPAWMAMLDDLTSGVVPEDFCDWFEVERSEGRDANVAMERRFIDPTKPLAEEILSKTHGALITSATLRDNAGEEDWQAAELRTGAHHLIEPPKRHLFGSPFDYGAQSRVLVVGDVNRRDADALACAYRELFLAAHGGALGLFTAIRALRAVEARLREPLAEAGLSLYAQHVDALDTGALVDLFRGEENSCLLGTDALRDGVDVPGQSLRLVVFDKVPWPKPTILHKARRARFGKTYDDRLTRLRLKQAFGRLIRKRTDRGCFVILEGATPSRLLAALPPEAPVARCTLAEAVREIGTFLG